ncbi:uncharacterized protein C8A04DRAFT_39266 [Dichotomopilus funicola]|uniref:Uncharacterized protein n=1 Tax=Dichotomopilus funicola TaxID=1934379 RepID=A0AAN6ZKJ2_9PEZI|nr:hypothetical protein C8A04DRAFT_39266 [Dichotomopilus funicola]
MRSQFWLLSAAGSLAAAADWPFGQDLDYRGGHIAHAIPRATQALDRDDTNGWAPEPTEGPSAELVRRRQNMLKMRRQTSSNTWVDEHTCGWLAEQDSVAFTCASNYRCATDTNEVVGCTSDGAANPFFTVCLDYQAVKAGACESVGSQTGCCMSSTAAECITYLWPGSTIKSMYRCYSERAVITMLETPSGLSETTTTTTSSTRSKPTTATTESSSSSAAPGQTESVGPPIPTNSGNSNNTGAIVGGVVGGVAVLALIAGGIAFFVIRSRKKAKESGTGTAYSAVAPNDNQYPPGGPASPMPPSTYAASSMSPPMSHAGGYNPSTYGGGTTLHPDSHYAPSVAPGPPTGAYDVRNSYYDPAKAAADQHGGHGVPVAYAPYGGAGGQQQPYPGHQAYKPPPHQPPIQELDNSNVPAGQHENPVEMAANSPTQR